MEAVYRAARAATPRANTLPKPAASWLAAPVKVIGVEVVAVLLVLAVDEALVVATVELAGAAELVAGAAEEAGAAEADEVAGAADEAGAAEELEPPAARAAQAAWAAVRVSVNIWLVYVEMNGIVV